MDDNFKRYVEAEVKEILSVMDEEVKCDPVRLRKAAISWIEKNAELFRRRWQSRQAA